MMGAVGIAAILAATVVISLVIQIALAHGFVRCLRRARVESISDVDCPRAAVVLCLRGGDPFLEHCLTGLMNQDYPNYQLRFIVDHPEDPANAILQQALQTHGCTNYRLDYLTEPLDTCSLKCSCLVQVLNTLDPDIEFIAQLDADTTPHRTWLRELATGLKPPEVGAATGNRWYMPDEITAGSMVRNLWNAAAIVQMYWYRIAWGGTLAIKVDSIRRANLIDRWGRALCEDTMLRQQLRSIGQSVAFVPTLMMVNRESCTLSSFYTWVRRQLLTARLYHPLWSLVLAHGVSSILLLIAGWGIVLWTLLTGKWVAFVVSCVSMMGYQYVLTSLIPWMENAVKHVLSLRGENSNWDAKLGFMQKAYYVTLTQWVYTAALLSAQFARRVDWRQINYLVRGAWDIRMLGYRPYNSTETREQGNAPESL